MKEEGLRRRPNFRELVGNTTFRFKKPPVRKAMLLTPQDLMTIELAKKIKLRSQIARQQEKSEGAENKRIQEERMISELAKVHPSMREDLMRRFRQSQAR